MKGGGGSLGELVMEKGGAGKCHVAKGQGADSGDLPPIYGLQ